MRKFDHFIKVSEDLVKSIERITSQFSAGKIKKGGRDKQQSAPGAWKWKRCLRKKRWEKAMEHGLKNSNHCYGGCCLVSDEIADKFIELKENKIEVEQETEVAEVIVLSDEELEIIKKLNDKKN